MKVFNIPTGKICIDKFDKGKLEFLSIGDYGRITCGNAILSGTVPEIDHTVEYI